MKNLILLLSVAGLASHSISTLAQDPAQLKETSLQACDAQSTQVPEAHREMVLRMCRCTAENTDYESLIAKSAAGDLSFQDDALAVAKQCSAQG